jgi:pimeloyl-ACP methyl ester carboxylesterase
MADDERTTAMSEVILVHGAWHGAWCWARVVAELDSLGVSSHAVELPLTGLADDAAVARVAIESAIDRSGPGVVVVGHSYGGLVISEAAAGIDGVGRLVYLAAFMTDQGEDELSILAAHHSPVPDAVVVADGGAAIDPAKAHALFYGDSDAATVAEIVPLLRPMRGGGGLTGAPAWKSIPSTYVVCTEDGALPPLAQREMATRANAVVEWPTDHSPFLTRPEALAALIASCVATVPTSKET